MRKQILDGVLKVNECLHLRHKIGFFLMVSLI